MDKLRTYVVASTILCVSATGALAFDGKRSGFVLGFGVGGAVTGFDQQLAPGGLDDPVQQTQTAGEAYVIDVRLGVGMSDRLLILVDSSDLMSTRLNHGQAGLSIAYYTGPEVYLLGSAGIASFSIPTTGDSHTGWGARAGIGWELDRHFSIESIVGWSTGHQEQETGGWFWPYKPAVDTRAWSFSLTMNVLAY